MLINEMLEVLQNNNLKITTFRKYLVDIFCEYDHTLLSAKMIKEALNRTFEYNASFDTIYKNLTVFCELSLIHEKVINHESFFILSTTLEEHHHFICLKCGEVIDVEDFCPDEQIKASYPDLEITGHNLEVYGLCSDCKYSDLNE